VELGGFGGLGYSTVGRSTAFGAFSGGFRFGQDVFFGRGCGHHGRGRRHGRVVTAWVQRCKGSTGVGMFQALIATLREEVQRLVMAGDRVAFSSSLPKVFVWSVD
jgi:hypothetical protein